MGASLTLASLRVAVLQGKTLEVSPGISHIQAQRQLAFSSLADYEIGRQFTARILHEAAIFKGLFSSDKHEANERLTSWARCGSSFAGNHDGVTTGKTAQARARVCCLKL